MDTEGMCHVVEPMPIYAANFLINFRGGTRWLHEVIQKIDLLDECLCGLPLLLFHYNRVMMNTLEQCVKKLHWAIIGSHLEKF